jgi:hypothetical protein
MLGTGARQSSGQKATEAKERGIVSAEERLTREKTLDKTVADSFPASDPPSTMPDPSEDSF